MLASRAPKGRVSALILSPTRELARQIGVESQKMLTFHGNLKSQVGMGEACIALAWAFFSSTTHVCGAVPWFRPFCAPGRVHSMGCTNVFAHAGI